LEGDAPSAPCFSVVTGSACMAQASPPWKVPLGGYASQVGDLSHQCNPIGTSFHPSLPSMLYSAHIDERDGRGGLILVPPGSTSISSRI